MHPYSACTVAFKSHPAAGQQLCRNITQNQSFMNIKVTASYLLQTLLSPQMSSTLH